MSSTRFATGCQPVDALLGGGVDTGTVTQVYGPPAAGKTNLALGVTAEAVANGETVVYVDTEDLSGDRLEQFLQGYDQPVDELAARVLIESAHDFDEQRTAVHSVESLAEEAGVVILDSATGFYRLTRTDDDNGETLRAVADQVAHLLGLARRFDLAVVVTNQVYTDPDTDRPQPLGGHTLGHWTGTILRLERFRAGTRRATLEKHRSRAAGNTATFQITDDGIVPVDDPV